MVDGSFTTGNFAKNMTGEEVNFVNASMEVNDLIENVSKELKIPIRK